MKDYFPNYKKWHELGYRVEDDTKWDDEIYLYLANKKDDRYIIRFTAKREGTVVTWNASKELAFKNGASRKLKFTKKEEELLVAEKAAAWEYLL